MKYILPVIAISVLFNIPKFFESEVKYDPDYPDEPFIDVTELRTNPGTVGNCTIKLLAFNSRETDKKDMVAWHRTFKETF